MSTHKIILWAPRILSILLILMLFMLSFDVFEVDDVWYRLILGFLIHNIPAFVLTIALVLAWKYPLVGAVIYTIAGLFYAFYMLITFGLEMVSGVLTLGIPAIFIGVLFYLTYQKN
ncbi:MAG: hypothetical protein JXC35_01340 [Acholeplasmataceae bacterium]|nr:hypothetical protein [Acholeplasmataceae bacterium]